MVRPGSGERGSDADVECVVGIGWVTCWPAGRGDVGVRLASAISSTRSTASGDHCPPPGRFGWVRRIRAAICADERPLARSSSSRRTASRTLPRFRCSAVVIAACTASRSGSCSTRLPSPSVGPAQLQLHASVTSFVFRAHESTSVRPITEKPPRRKERNPSLRAAARFRQSRAGTPEPDAKSRVSIAKEPSRGACSVASVQHDVVGGSFEQGIATCKFQQERYMA